MTDPTTSSHPAQSSRRPRMVFLLTISLSLGLFLLFFQVRHSVLFSHRTARDDMSIMRVGDELRQDLTTIGAQVSQEWQHLRTPPPPPHAPTTTFTTLIEALQQYTPSTTSSTSSPAIITP